MSDLNPSRPHDDDTSAEHVAGAPAAGPAPDQQPPAPPAPATPAPAASTGDRRYRRRLPLVTTGAALFLGILLGAGAVAAASEFGDGHGEDRGNHQGSDTRADGTGNDGDNGRNGNGKAGRNGRDDHSRPNDDGRPTPAPSTSSTGTPVPSASS
ncbi:hypothetical protein [Actinoplanes sp. HUAS TT8]|uniref:hypothetical protein n=1 Tax=Actinoplanes sp. HUAS TT8 TaxID=3447453 RepID=UPI003F526D07